MSRLFVLTGSIILGLLLFQTLGVLVFAPAFGYGSVAESFTVVQEIMADPAAYPDANLFLLLVQATSSLGAFILIPLLFLQFLARDIAQDLNIGRPNTLLAFLAVGVVLAGLPFNSLVNYWNVNLELPAFLEGFERWAMAEEQSRKELTKFITDFDNIGQLLLGIFVVAVLPGVSEELLFRGILQNTMLKLSGKAHLSIWAAAFVFSAIHFQFYGLVPRMLLGAMFGYMYLWSGNLWVPVLAHFTNNFVTLVTIHLYNIGEVELEDGLDTRPAYSLAMLSLIISLALLYAFYDYVQKQKQASGSSLTE